MNNKTANIVVPLVSSDQSAIAFEQACNIARLMKLDVKAVNVDNGSKMRNPLGKGNNEIREEMRRKLDDLVKKTAEAKGLDIQMIYKRGKISEKVVEEIKKQSPGFVVMSSLHSSSEPGNRRIGRNAHKIIRTSPSPVISINGTYHYSGCRSILLPLDLTVETRQKVNKAIEFAQYFNSVIKVVSLISSGISDENRFRINQQIRQVKKFIEKSNIVCTAETSPLKKGSEASQIIQYAKDQGDVDLIMIMIRKDITMLEYYMGSITQKILRESDIPVMTIIPDNMGVVIVGI